MTRRQRYKKAQSFLPNSISTQYQLNITKTSYNQTTFFQTIIPRNLLYQSLIFFNKFAKMVSFTALTIASVFAIAASATPSTPANPAAEISFGLKVGEPVPD